MLENLEYEPYLFIFLILHIRSTHEISYKDTTRLLNLIQKWKMSLQGEKKINTIFAI